MSISINAKDGSVWVADTDAIRVKKLSSAGKVLFVIDKGFSTQPMSIGVDSKNGSCWVATVDSIYKFASDSKKLLERSGFNEPVLIVNQNNSECWIADSNNARIVRLSSDGKQLGVYSVDGVNQPKSISINHEDNSCWILDPFTQKVAKLSSDGNVITQASVSPAGGAIMATSVSASADGGCWVAVLVDFVTPNKDLVMKISTDGKLAKSVSGFHMPSTVAYDYKDKGCWVADSNNGRIVKLSAAGQKILDIKGFGQPKAVTVGYIAK